MASMKKLPDSKTLAGLYQSGLSQKQIAEKYGTCQGTVWRALKRAGCPSRNLSDSHKIAYRKGRRKPAGAVLKKGKDSWNWKDGAQRRGYRGKIAKEQCQTCRSKKNLGIHHINLDHYDDRPENLQVLCVSCHMSLHKTAYWKAIQDGTLPPKSNGPVGRTR